MCTPQHVLVVLHNMHPQHIKEHVLWVHVVDKQLHALWVHVVWNMLKNGTYLQMRVDSILSLMSPAVREMVTIFL